jgi:hypothetical protein
MPGSNSSSSPDLDSTASIERLSISNIAPVDPQVDGTFYLQGKSPATRLFLYTQDQRAQRKAPWFPEYGSLHRLNIADINNKLSVCKKEIYEIGAASNDQMEKLRRLLKDQGMSFPENNHIYAIDNGTLSYSNSKLPICPISKLAASER